MKIIIIIITLISLLAISIGYQLLISKHYSHCGENSVCLGIPTGVDFDNKDFGNNSSDMCLGLKVLKHTETCLGG